MKKWLRGLNLNQRPPTLAALRQGKTIDSPVWLRKLAAGKNEEKWLRGLDLNQRPPALAALRQYKTNVSPVWLRKLAAGKNKEKWLRGLDLNQRPPGYEPDELPGCSTPRINNSGRSNRGQTNLPCAENASQLYHSLYGVFSNGEMVPEAE